MHYFYFSSFTIFLSSFALILMLRSHYLAASTTMCFRCPSGVKFSGSRATAGRHLHGCHSQPLGAYTPQTRRNASRKVFVEFYWSKQRQLQLFWHHLLLWMHNHYPICIPNWPIFIHYKIGYNTFFLCPVQATLNPLHFKTHKQNPRSSEDFLMLDDYPKTQFKTLRDRSFTFKAVGKWNVLPLELRTCHSLCTFETHLKTFLVMCSYPDCWFEPFFHLVLVNMMVYSLYLCKCLHFLVCIMLLCISIKTRVELTSIHTL